MNAFVIQVNYQGHVPLADMAKRFGLSSTVGAALSFKMKHNLWLDFEGNFLFGNDIKEDSLFSSIKASNGSIIGVTGIFESINLMERGFMFRASIGKVFPLGKPNVNSGLYVKLGAGFLQHKIGISTDNDAALPQISGDYIKGYDRMTNGLMLSQFIGYMYLSNSRILNFYAGFEIIEGFTKGRRTWLFDERKSGEDNRTDILISFKIGWLLPIYYKTTQKYYYN